MKNKIKGSLLIAMAVMSLAVYSQPTNKMNYQAVARDASGAILGNQPVGILISIENGSGGPVLYSERQVPTTNQFGLFTLQIGAGVLVSGNYNTINWSNGDQWLKVDMDPTGGNSYTPMGESQLLSVPFANYAASGGTTYTAGSGIDITGNVISNTGGTITSVTAGAGLNGGVITTSGTISMPNVGTPGTYGSSTQVPVITTDAQGRVSGVTTANIASNTYTGGTGITVAGNVINSVWTQLGNNIYNNNIANVGIGTAAPAYPLNVVGNNAVATGLVQNANAAGIGFAAQNTAATGAGNGIGLYGYTRQGAGFGVYGFNVDTTGTGVVGIGNNVPNYSLLNAGSGGAFFGNVVGLYAFTSGSGGFGLLGRSTDTANAFGVGGIANGVAFAAASAGGAFSGLNYAVSAIQTNTSTTTQEAAGYFGSRGPTGSATLVEAYSNTDIHYKIWQSVVGAVATCIPDLAGNAVTLHAAETPEFYFQDYGQAQLVNGRTHVTIDPILAKNVTINERHPLRVFVQLEGDCNGVYVTNKTASGFDVVELNGGTSNVGFQWTITCNVADAQIGNHLSRFSDLRFEPGPINEAKEISPARENAPQPAVKYFNK